MARFLVVVLVAVLSCLGMAACGGASRDTGSPASVAERSPASTTKPPVVTTKPLYAGDVDAEEDRDGKDADDEQVLAFGQRAAAEETRAVAVLIKRYYTAAAGLDGMMACSLLYSQIAESVVENYGRPPGPPSLRGETCAAVMSKIFQQQHRQLSVDASVLRVTEVRVDGNRGLALLDLRSKPQRHILVQREHGVWKVEALLDIGMP